MRHVYPLSIAAVLFVLFLLLGFRGTRRYSSFHARHRHSCDVPCQYNSWNWRSTARNGLGGWMNEIGHNHIGHGQY